VGRSESAHFSDGWHQPDTIPDHLSPDSALLQALMDLDTPDRERLRFLGG
jgi:hypothetical protein